MTGSRGWCPHLRRRPTRSSGEQEHSRHLGISGARPTQRSEPDVPNVSSAVGDYIVRCQQAPSGGCDGSPALPSKSRQVTKPWGFFVIESGWRRRRLVKCEAESDISGHLPRTPNFELIQCPDRPRCEAQDLPLPQLKQPTPTPAPRRLAAGMPECRKSGGCSLSSVLCRAPRSSPEERTVPGMCEPAGS